MANTAQRLAHGCISYPLAEEIARQILAGAGNGNANKLITLGVPPMQANALADGINASSVKSEKLAAAMWTTSQARLIAAVYANP